MQPTKESRHCERCEELTWHLVEVERDATKPPEEFKMAEAEGYASQEDCIFYANGDSEYRVTCEECGLSVRES